MKLLKYALVFAGMLVFVLFVISNLQETSVRFLDYSVLGTVSAPELPTADPAAVQAELPHEERRMPVAILMIVCFAVGFFAHYFLSLRQTIPLARKVRRLGKQVRAKEAEAERLRVERDEAQAAASQLPVPVEQQEPASGGS